MRGVGASPSPQIRDPCHLHALHDALNMPPSHQDTSILGVGPLLDKSIYNVIALGERDASGRSLVAVYPIVVYASRIEIEIIRSKMEILLDHFNSIVSHNVLVPLNHCTQRAILQKRT